MKVTAKLQSSSARGVIVAPAPSANLYGGNLVRAINERYGFVEYPTRISDFDYKSGVKFLQGFFDGHAVDMEILEQGVRASCKDGTDVCDAFIDDLLATGKRIGVKFDETPSLRVYSSAIEFELDGKFDALFDRIGVIGGLIGGKIASYGGPGDSYRGIGVTFIGNLQGPAPEPFRVERRVNHSMESNVFFSIAPLSSADHVSVLREFERLIS